MAEYISNQAYLLEDRQFILLIACSPAYHRGLHCNDNTVAGIVKQYGCIQMYTMLFASVNTHLTMKPHHFGTIRIVYE